MQLSKIQIGTDEATETDRRNMIYSNILRKTKMIIIQNNYFIYSRMQRNLNGSQWHFPVTKLSKELPGWTVLLLGSHGYHSATNLFNIFKL